MRRSSYVHHNGLSSQIIDAELQVHATLGPGLLESVYHACLCHELQERGLVIESQAWMPASYDSVKLNLAFRLDLTDY